MDIFSQHRKYFDPKNDFFDTSAEPQKDFILICLLPPLIEDYFRFYLFDFFLFNT